MQQCLVGENASFLLLLGLLLLNSSLSLGSFLSLKYILHILFLHLFNFISLALYATLPPSCNPQQTLFYSKWDSILLLAVSVPLSPTISTVSHNSSHDVNYEEPISTFAMRYTGKVMAQLSPSTCNGCRGSVCLYLQIASITHLNPC